MEPQLDPSYVLKSILRLSISMCIYIYIYVYTGVSQNQGYPFGGPYNKDYNILRSTLGPPILGNYHIQNGTYDPD